MAEVFLDGGLVGYTKGYARLIIDMPPAHGKSEAAARWHADYMQKERAAKAWIMENAEATSLRKWVPTMANLSSAGIGL